MSIEALGWALRRKGITATKKLVLLALANYADEDGVCWPSVRTIMDIACASRATTFRALNELEEDGLITRDSRLDFSGRQTSSSYRLIMPGSGGEGLTVRRGGSHGETGEGLTGETPRIHQKEPLKKKEGKSEQEGDPVTAAADAWNDMAKAQDLPVAFKVAGKRAVQLRARVSEVGPDGWRAVIAAIPSMPFLIGRNERGWKADLDWLVNPANFAKVIEGRYAPNRRPLDLSAGAGAPANDGAMDGEKRIRLMRSAVEMVDDGTVSAWNPSWTNQLGVDYAGARAELAALERQPQPDLGLVLTTPQP